MKIVPLSFIKKLSRRDLVQHAVYFIAEIVLKSTVVARFKLHRSLIVTCSEIGNKNIPLSVSNKARAKLQLVTLIEKLT
jgi:hypothetical protein